MKAIVYEKYGSPEVLQIKELEKPKPNDEEALLKIYATSVTPMNYRERGAKVPLWPIIRLTLGFKPKETILTGEIAGEIIEVGKKFTKFKPGDKVFGFGKHAYSEYRVIPENAFMLTMPESMSMEEGASVAFGGLTAMYFLKTKAQIKAGQKILINGASGGVGVFAVQLAKIFGAEVTGVCSTKNVELVKSLGADRVIDYTKENFTKDKMHKYDIIFDVAAKSSFSKCKKILTKKGKYLTTVPSYRLIWQMFVTTRFGGKKAIFGYGSSLEDLIYLKQLIEADKLRIIIDRTYSYEEIVEAHKYAEQGHKTGSVVVKFVN